MRANTETALATAVRAAARGLLLSLVAGAVMMGCVVQEGPANSAQGASKSPDCRAQQDGCVADCKAKAPDEASRQPCYNQCMRQSQSCQ
ncbi:MAG TPA: hypothetical protein ENK57_17865 [Polyangiaceae bacterium]|nr:hypothetical protein [Polyangiaceae bacterium]